MVWHEFQKGDRNRLLLPCCSWEMFLLILLFKLSNPLSNRIESFYFCRSFIEGKILQETKWFVDLIRKAWTCVPEVLPGNNFRSIYTLKQTSIKYCHRAHSQSSFHCVTLDHVGASMLLLHHVCIFTVCLRDPVCQKVTVRMTFGGQNALAQASDCV